MTYYSKPLFMCSPPRGKHFLSYFLALPLNLLPLAETHAISLSVFNFNYVFTHSGSSEQLLKRRHYHIHPNGPNPVPMPLRLDTLIISRKKRAINADVPVEPDGTLS